MNLETLEIFFEHVRNVANAIASGIIPDLPPEPTGPDKDQRAAIVINESGLNVRSAPMIEGRLVDRVEVGTQVVVYDEYPDGLDLWVRIGENRYCAFFYGGKKYLEYL